MKETKTANIFYQLGKVAIAIDKEENDDIVNDIIYQYNDYLLNDDDVMRLCEYYHIEYRI